MPSVSPVVCRSCVCILQIRASEQGEVQEKNHIFGFARAKKVMPQVPPPPPVAAGTDGDVRAAEGTGDAAALPAPPAENLEWKF